MLEKRVYCSVFRKMHLIRLLYRLSVSAYKNITTQRKGVLLCGFGCFVYLFSGALWQFFTRILFYSYFNSQTKYTMSLIKLLLVLIDKILFLIKWYWCGDVWIPHHNNLVHALPFYYQLIDGHSSYIYIL